MTQDHWDEPRSVDAAHGTAPGSDLSSPSPLRISLSLEMDVLECDGKLLEGEVQQERGGCGLHRVCRTHGIKRPLAATASYQRATHGAPMPTSH